MDTPNTPSYCFSKQERLKSHSVITQLFKKGRSFGRYPIRLVWLKIEESKTLAPVQVAFSVPKSKFKSAVDRNRIKRQMREAWRLNKHLLYEQVTDRNLTYAFMILYVSREEVSYSEIEKNMQKMIQKFVKVSAS